MLFSLPKLLGTPLLFLTLSFIHIKFYILKRWAFKVTLVSIIQSFHSGAQSDTLTMKQVSYKATLD